jgi:branched-chain amino acid transport system substrate-binding protein
MRALNRVLIPVLAASGLLLAACGGNANRVGGSSGDASGSDVIKVGVSGPLTGANAAWGIAMKGGAELAAAELKQQGGVKIGNKTYNFEIVGYDDQFDAVGATSAINRMVSQDGIKYVFGPTTGAAVSAVEPIIESNKVLEMMSGFGSSLIAPKYDYVFRTVLTPNEYCGAWYQWVKAHEPNVHRVALIGPNDVVGQGSVKPCEAAVASAGMTSQSFYYERSSQDYSSIVTRLLAFNPDAIDMTGGAPGEAAGIAKQLVQSGFKGLSMKSGGAAINTIASVAGPAAAKGHLYFEQVLETAAPVAKFLADFKAKYQSSGEESIAVEYHDSLLLLAQAMQKAGSTDTTTVRDALRANSFDLPLMGHVIWGGQTTYGVAGQILCTGNILEWDGQKGNVVGQIQATSP